MRKLVSFLLTLVLLCSCFSVFAEAAPEMTEEEMQAETAEEQPQSEEAMEQFTMEDLLATGMNLDQILETGITVEDLLGMGLTMEDLQVLDAVGKELPELPEGMEYITIPLYLPGGGGTVLRQDIPGVFCTGDTSVMYMSMKEYCETLTGFCSSVTPEFQLQFITDETGMYMVRENGAAAGIMREGNTVFFVDYDKFKARNNAVNPGDCLSTVPFRKAEDGSLLTDENGEPVINLFRCCGSDADTFEKTGTPIATAPDDYNIPCFWTEDNVYLPIAFLNTILNPVSELDFLWNGQALFVIVNSNLDDTTTNEMGLTIKDLFYDVPSPMRSQALTELTYNLLCMELDLQYGLKESHGIGENFDDYFAVTGLKEKMLNPDGRVFSDAITELTSVYFSDFHSVMAITSPYAGRDHITEDLITTGSLANLLYIQERNETARNASGLSVASEDGMASIILEPYQEVGDTAYITFDSFNCVGVDYYSEETIDNLEYLVPYDTIALVQYADRQIRRENSPVRRVVVDLSNNSGGAVDAAVYLTSWLIGDCKLSTTNPLTEGRYTVVYEADVNLDGKITEEDHLDSEKFEICCLISGTSFSCGNLVPCLLKESGKVILLGQTSGGGSCTVLMTTTADGNFFKHSSTKRFSFVKNGSYYDVDRGVDPHVWINKTEHFYDRVWLNEFIDNLP